MCKKCIRDCPVEAIFEQPVPKGDGGMQCSITVPAAIISIKNYGCAICLVACPFSQVGYNIGKSRFKGNPNALHFGIPVGEVGEETIVKWFEIFARIQKVTSIEHNFRTGRRRQIDHQYPYKIDETTEKFRSKSAQGW